MSDIIDAETTLLTSLRSNITDPMSRGNQEWIHQGATRRRERTPSIRIQRAGDDPETKYIGTATQFSTVRFRVIIQVGLSDKTTISGTEYNDVALLNYIVGLVSDHLKSVASTIGSPIKWIQRIDAGGYTYDSDTKRHVNIMMYKTYVVD